MGKVFISGSIHISSLPPQAIEKIDSIISQNLDVLIGDAKGVDLAVQKYLYKKNYKNVTVYYAGSEIRNNVGQWRTKNVLPENGEKGRDLYTLKDRLMAKDTDYGLMVWDSESKGTLNNILLMDKLNKKFVVVFDGLVADNIQTKEIMKITEKSKTEKNTLKNNDSQGKLPL